MPNYQLSNYRDANSRAVNDEIMYHVHCNRRQSCLERTRALSKRRIRIVFSLRLNERFYLLLLIAKERFVFQRVRSKCRETENISALWHRARYWENWRFFTIAKEPQRLLLRLTVNCGPLTGNVSKLSWWEPVCRDRRNTRIFWRGKLACQCSCQNPH